jgi:hypothetical protein
LRYLIQPPVLYAVDSTLAKAGSKFSIFVVFCAGCIK